MDSARDLFDQAIGLPPEQREAFVRTASDDPDVVERVLSLLAHHTESEGLFEETVATRYRDLTSPLDGQIDEFRIIRELGRGGMGIVYLAEDTLLDRQVALKILSSHLVGAERALARFRHEAKAVAGLNHPAIVQIHKYGQADGVHFMAMAYVEGDTLSHRLRSLGWPRLRPDAPPEPDTTAAAPPRTRAYLDEAASMIGTIADALEHAHRHQVIHRDVKPSNILIDRDGQAFLTDFGIARMLAEEPLTMTGDVAGTTHYMSPEQAGAAAVQIDHRTDVFSLGVVLFEVLTLRHPFDAETNEGVLKAIREREPPRVRDLNPTVPKDLATICHKAMEKRPSDRYQTAAHMAADLRCWGRGDPILARSPSIWRRARHLAHAYRIASLSAAVAVLVFMVLGLSLYELSRRRSQMMSVAITANQPGVTIRLQHVNPSTLELGPVRVLGPAPFQGRLRLGQYRITAFRDQAFAEHTVFLTASATRVEIAMVIVAPDQQSRDDMILVPGGSYMFGDPDRDDAMSARVIQMPAFYIDRYEVSNAEYRSFVEATGHSPPRYWSMPGFDAEALADRPVVAVTQEDAMAYAHWAGKRLPTVFEWDCAMRLPDARRLPWHDAPPADLPSISVEDAARLNAAKWDWALDEYISKTRSVDSHVAWATPDGIHHACTNVSEITESIHFARSNAVVVKGASWIHPPQYFDLVHTWSAPLQTVSMKTGFRCARSASVNK